MDNLLHSLYKSRVIERHNPKREVIIISDAIMLSIELILDHHDLKSAFNHIFTNPTHVNKNNGRVSVQTFPKDENHFCALCEHDMCKGSILKNYVDERLGIYFT